MKLQQKMPNRKSKKRLVQMSSSSPAPSTSSQLDPDSDPGRESRAGPSSGSDSGDTASNGEQSISLPLITYIKDPSISIKGLAKNWLVLYENEPYTPTATLLQLFLDMTGSQFTYPAIFNFNEFRKELPKLTKEIERQFELDNPNCLLYGSADKLACRANFVRFLKDIISEMKDVIYHKWWLRICLLQLLNFTEVSVPELAHLAIVAALPIHSSLVKKKVQIQKEMEHTTEQINNFRGQTEEALVFLKQRKVDHEMELKELNTMIYHLFHKVIIKYTRSAKRDIINIFLTDFEKWITLDPNTFIENTYLEHLVYLLQHSQTSVRRRVYSIIITLYKEEHKEKMFEFTVNHKDIFLSDCYRDTPTVTVKAIEALTIITRFYPTAITEAECSSVARLVFLKSQIVARAAGHFLWTHMELSYPNKKMSTIEKVVKEYINKYQRTAQGVEYFIDALWGDLDFLHFENMVMFLEERIEAYSTLAEDDDEVFEQTQFEVLIEMIVCYTRQAVTGMPPKQRMESVKGLSFEKKLQCSELQDSITQSLMEKLPKFLQFFQKFEPKCLELLLKLPSYFKLDLYITSRKEHSYNKLADILITTFFGQTNRCVLNQCSSAINVLLDFISPIVVVSNRKLEDSLNQCYNTCLTAWEHINESLAENEETLQQYLQRELYDSTCKVAQLLKHNRMQQKELCEKIKQLLRMMTEGNSEGLETEFWCDCLFILYYDMTWEHLEAGSTCDMVEDTTEFEQKRQIIFDTMKENVVGEEVRILAFRQVCDFMVLFGKPFDQSSKENTLQNLIWEPSSIELDNVWNVLDELLFKKSLPDSKDVVGIKNKMLFLGSYIKLIHQKIVPYIQFAEVLQYYVKFKPVLGGLMMETLGEFKNRANYNPSESDPAIHATVIIEALKIRFCELSEEEITDETDYTEVEEMAKSFWKVFTARDKVTSQAMLYIHTQGMEFVAQEEPAPGTSEPPKVRFLEILAKCNTRMEQSLQQTLLAKLKTFFRSGSEWYPLQVYRRALGYKK